MPMHVHACTCPSIHIICSPYLRTCSPQHCCPRCCPHLQKGKRRGEQKLATRMKSLRGPALGILIKAHHRPPHTYCTAFREGNLISTNPLTSRGQVKSPTYETWAKYELSWTAACIAHSDSHGNISLALADRIISH